MAAVKATRVESLDSVVGENLMATPRSIPHIKTEAFEHLHQFSAADVCRRRLERLDDAVKLGLI